MLSSIGSRICLASSLSLLVSIAACDSISQADRSVFGPNGEKWCFEYNAWKHISSDRLNCGECNSPCGNDQVCFQGECISRQDEKPAQTNTSNQQYCGYYASCFAYGCSSECQDDSTCEQIEEACAEYGLEGKTADDLRAYMNGILVCEPNTGQCVAKMDELPEDPPEDDSSNGDGSGYVAPPPPPTNLDTSCGSSYTNCTLTNKVCESGSCVCKCESEGVCYSPDPNQRHTLTSFPGTLCGASCICSENGWISCQPLSACPI